MSSFTIEETPLSGLMTIKRKQITDDRGFLARLFCQTELSAVGWKMPVAQINHTSTRVKGAIRGMHFQHPPHAELKLVNCLRGAVFDVAVDIRSDSPTFLQWFGTSLSADNCLALLIPAGFAHGFQALTDNVELLYCHSVPYCKEAEGGLNPFDPKIGVQWPKAITEISEKDNSHPFIRDAFQGITL